mgnify:CR=1 FL=1
MTDINNSIKKTKQTITLLLFLFIVISIIGLCFRHINGTLTLWSYISVGIGIFIIYSLYQAKSWAKLYITIACAFMILISIMPTIANFTNQKFVPAIINVVLMSWAVYLIRFLNIGEEYEKYSQIVKSGFNILEDAVQDISDIVTPDRMIHLDRKKVSTPSEYKQLAEKLLSKDISAERITGVVENESSITIETSEVDFEIEFSPESVFFEKSFVDKLNSILEELSSEYMVTVFHPQSIAIKKDSKIACLTVDERTKLKENGMME